MCIGQQQPYINIRPTMRTSWLFTFIRGEGKITARIVRGIYAPFRTLCQGCRNIIKLRWFSIGVVILFINNLTYIICTLFGGRGLRSLPLNLVSQATWGHGLDSSYDTGTGLFQEADSRVICLSFQNLFCNHTK